MATWPANGSNIDGWDAVLLAWLTEKVFANDGSFKDNFIVDTSFTIDDACNIGLGTTTGTQIGTAATQKLGFYGATPVDQAANTEDLKDVLVALGFIAAGGATPLDLDAGLLTAGNVVPAADDTYYVGKNSISSPLAYKGLVLKDTTNGNYYRVEIISGVVTATQIV